jgi:anti-anti-sigma factor
MGPEVRTRGEVSIIDLPGRVTHGSGDYEMRQAIQNLIDTGKMLFLVNFEKVTYMDSAGIGELMACHKRAVEKKGVIKILKPNQKVLDLFVITHLNKVFELYDNEDEAIHSF